MANLRQRQPIPGMDLNSQSPPPPMAPPGPMGAPQGGAPGPQLRPPQAPQGQQGAPAQNPPVGMPSFPRPGGSTAPPGSILQQLVKAFSQR